MRVVLAPDGFKGSLSAPEVAAALAAGLARGLPGVQVDLAPLADGGEGTTQALVRATQGRLHTVPATGPLGDPLDATFGILGDGTTAVVETAAASGLVLVPPARRDPRRATTYGTGQLIQAALDQGCTRVIVGLGGSATVDGGAGLAQALGFSLRDAQGRDLARGGAALNELAAIAAPAAPAWAGVEVVAACDVTNPLLGLQGAATVYGPQKGADAAAVAVLEGGLTRLAERLEADLGREVRALPGGGAAGGLGAGLVGFLGARLTSGAELVCDAIGLARRLEQADLLITGEGRIDEQTAHAKGPLVAARLARSLGVPAIAVGGGVAPGAYALLEDEFAALLAIPDRPLALDEAVAEAEELLRRAGERIGRLLRLGAELSRPRQARA